MHQKRTKKIVLFDYMKNGSPQKEQLFCSFLNVTFLEKNVICTFCLTKCIRKGQKNCSFWLHEAWLSPQKEHFFCSFLNVIFLEKKTSFVLFALPNASEKDKKIVPFDYMKNGSHHKKKIFWFFSERHLSRKKTSFVLLPCQMHQKRKKKKSFWLHEEWLSPQKEQIFCSFLNVFLCTFSRAKCIRKGQQKFSFWIHEEWLSPQKEQLFCSFLNVTFLEKNVICTFCLAKCIRKGQQNCSLWLHEEWLSPQKEQFFLFFSERHLSRKKRHLYFLPCQMHHKRTTKLFLLTTWTMALSTKRAIFLFFS